MYTSYAACFCFNESNIQGAIDELVNVCSSWLLRFCFLVPMLQIMAISKTYEK